MVPGFTKIRIAEMMQCRERPVLENNPEGSHRMRGMGRYGGRSIVATGDNDLSRSSRGDPEEAWE
jgi:hypothetical protein